MKKALYAVLVVVIATGMSMAQNNKGANSYIPTTDVQGAHENGGRGCAGCHAPHSGGRGSGGGSVSGQTTALGAEGDSGLWGTDTSAVTSAAGVFNFDGYTATLTGQTWSSGSLYTGVATCLSCHDGNISKGAMMSGQAYEQSFGLLNFATNVGSNGQATSVNLYGTAPIPTLLGNDGGTAGDYSNDHPVGPMANLGKVAAAALGNGLTYTVNGTKLTMVVTPGTTYANFVTTYGTPAISSLASNNDGIAGNQYVVCTTCHNQHQQNIYSSLGHGAVPIANGAVTSARTIFYVNGPYNPGAPYDPTHVPSTNAFCLQCHFSHSSQYFGSGTTVGVAF
jgi:hypothetical protein